MSTATSSRIFFPLHYIYIALHYIAFMGTLKPQSNVPLYSNTVIGTLAEEGPGRAAAPPSPLIAVPNVTAHHQRQVYQMHIIRCSSMITSGL